MYNLVEGRCNLDTSKVVQLLHVLIVFA